MSDGLTTKTAQQIITRLIDFEANVDKTILLIALDKYRLSEHLKRACLSLGFHEKNIYIYSIGEKYEFDFDYIYCSEGNTFELLSFIKENGLLGLIQENFKKGNCVYIGASAGAMIAGKDVCFALEFDKNTVGLEDFKALELFDGTIIPHFTKAQLKRFLELTDETEKQKYDVIYSVANGRALVLEI